MLSLKIRDLRDIKQLRDYKEKPLGKLEHELVNSHLTIAVKIARKICRSRNFQIDTDELTSIVGLALCEAATRFKVEARVKFSTYSYYFIKGAIYEAINEVMVLGKNQIIEMSNNEEIDIIDTIPSNSNVEKEAELHEMSTSCTTALENLNKLERAIVIGVHVLEFKVAHVARQLGYSRGHTSEIRRHAINKLRTRMSQFKEAA